MKPKEELWRVGKNNPINVYDGDRPVCQCHTVADAYRIVKAVNALGETSPSSELRDLAITARAKRTFWLESYGVPVSMEFAEFAEAIGILIEHCEGIDQTLPNPSDYGTKTERLDTNPRFNQFGKALAKAIPTTVHAWKCSECGATMPLVPGETTPVRCSNRKGGCGRLFHNEEKG